MLRAMFGEITLVCNVPLPSNALALARDQAVLPLTCAAVASIATYLSINCAGVLKNSSGCRRTAALNSP